MNKVLWQISREFSAFFYSPIAYVVLGASVILNGGMFLLIVSLLSGPGAPPGAPMELLFSWIFFWLTVLILTPLITMRSLAEEKHSGTFETLITAPISQIQIVIAKYISCLLFYTLMWMPTIFFPLFLSRFTPLDSGPILSGYLGTFGVGVMLIAVGILCSALTKNQIVASLSTFSVIMILFLVGLLRHVDYFSTISIFSYMDLMKHMEDFSKGIVDTRYLVYYSSVAAFSLFAAVEVLSFRRWQG